MRKWTGWWSKWLSFLTNFSLLVKFKSRIVKPVLSLFHSSTFWKINLSAGQLRIFLGPPKSFPSLLPDVRETDRRPKLGFFCYGIEIVQHCSSGGPLGGFFIHSNGWPAEQSWLFLFLCLLCSVPMVFSLPLMCWLFVVVFFSKSYLLQ